MTQSLSLKSALIAFHLLIGSHDGVTMADALMRILARAGITEKVRQSSLHYTIAVIQYFQGGFFTLDNASNNKTCMDEVARRYRVMNIPFDSDDRRIMCFPHVINICCQHVISSFTNVELSDSPDDFVSAQPPDLPNLQTYEEAIRHDPVALGRNIVRVLRSSGQRRNAFNEILRDGNTKGWFNVKELQLLRDVKTRWDSVYSMLRRLRELRPVSLLPLYAYFYSNKLMQVIEHFMASPVNKDLASYKITDMEWTVLQDFEVVLEVCVKVIAGSDTDICISVPMSCNRSCPGSQPQSCLAPSPRLKCSCPIGNTFARIIHRPSRGWTLV